MKYCGHCGKSISDKSKFCSFCGTLVTTLQSTKKEKQSKKKHRVGLAVVALLGIIAGVIVLVLMDISSSPEKMLIDSCLALYEGDFEEAWNGANFDKLYEVLDEAGYLNDDYYIGDELQLNLGTNHYEYDDVYDYYYDLYYETYDYSYNRAQNKADNYFGNDWEYEYEVTSTDEMSDKDLDRWTELINGPKGDFNVSKGVVITVRLDIEGKYQETTAKLKFYMLRVDGEWLLVQFASKTANSDWSYDSLTQYLWSFEEAVYYLHY